MAKIAWLISETHALIAAVRENPSLYDRRDPDYSRAKDDVWKRISLASGIRDKNADQCKIKWKTLRIQLRRIFVDKIKNNGNRSKVRWNCYDQLKFLFPHMDSATTDDIKKDADLTTMSYTGDDDDYEDFDNEANGGAQSDDSYATSPFQSTSNVELRASAQADSTNTTRIYKTENDSNPNQCVLGTYLPQNSPVQLGNEIDPLMTINTSNQTMPLPTNVPNYFLMDIGMQMERLNVIAQMEIKIEIHRLLLEKLRDPSNLR